MEFALGFVSGFISSIIALTSLIVFLGYRSLRKKEKELLTAINNKSSSKKSIEDRMKRVKQITDEQLDLSSAADGPQKNSLDGKYKNGLIRQMKQLDEEKNEILKSILEDGHDPELTTMDSSGVITKMKLSEFMAYMGIKMEPKANKQPVQNIGKFTVIRGGKSDDNSGNNSTN